MGYTGDAALDSMLGLGGGAASSGAAMPSWGGVSAATWINAGSSVLGKAMGPSSAGPSRADSSLWQQQTFDNSGWTVATGGSTAEGGSRGLDIPPWMILAVVALGVVAWVKTKSR